MLRQNQKKSCGRKIFWIKKPEPQIMTEKTGTGIPESLILKLTSWKLTVSKIQITFCILHRARVGLKLPMVSDN